MIRLLARIYTQTDYQTSYRSLPKLVLDGWSVSSINRARPVKLICAGLFSKETKNQVEHLIYGGLVQYFIDHTWHFRLAFFQPFLDLVDVKLS